MTKKLLRLPDVLERTALSKTTLYRMLGAKSFPEPIKQGKGSFWIDEEIDNYVARLMSARPGSQPTPASS